MYRKELLNVEGDYKFEGTITMTGKKIGKSSIEITGENVDIYEFMAILVGQGTETKNGQVKEEYLSDTTYIGIADGIGIYYYLDKDQPTEEDPNDYGWIRRVGEYSLE